MTISRTSSLHSVIDGRKYPYFIDFNEFVSRRYGVKVVDLVKYRRDIVEEATSRLIYSIEKGRAPPPAEKMEDEVLSFYIALLIAVLSNNKWIVSRFALAEAERGMDLLSSEPDEVVAEVARLAGVRSLIYRPSAYREVVALINGVPSFRMYNFLINFHEYVVVARRLLGDSSWKPVNLPVLRGKVFLDRNRVIRLIKEALNVYIEERAKWILSSVDVDEVERVLEEHIKKVEEAASKRLRPRFKGRGKIEVPKGLIIEEAFPPCISHLLTAARSGEHLSHHERFAIATFLLGIGAEIDQVVDVFRSMPDFNEKIARYQVEHLAGLRGSGKKYRVYSCEKMRTLGMCRADCPNARSPIQVYYRNIRSYTKKRRDEKSEAK